MPRALSGIFEEVTMLTGLAVPQEHRLHYGDGVSVVMCALRGQKRISPAEKMDRTGFRMRSQFYVGAWLGFCAGFMIAYSRSSKRFWGWSENSIEEKRDLQELSQRAQEGIPLYGETNQPQWIQAAAHRNSQFSQLKFSLFPMLNLVNHPYHGTDPAKYGVAGAPAVLEDSEGLQPGQTLLSVKKATQSKSE
ncbi:unnamed protein product [Mycena citricolor]|uniref:Uncharacterized protein n=1 Tax=Mycena citricolor TaxID=2018698 RepID=A0AAD2Q410_9AGAR|nr:unnamed protein product [Mycena citricolor]